MNHPPPKQSPNAPLAPPPVLGPQGRAVGLDIHPDTFAAAILEGRDALQARVRQSLTQQPLEALCAWAARQTTPEDVLILEASANSFTVAEGLAAIGRQVFILESHRAGQIGKSYLANDKVDAAKIARIYLSGLGIKVWQPDPETRQRRELLSTYQRCVKESTRAQQHLRSYLNEHALRLPKGFRLCRPEAGARLLALKDWSPRQKLLLQEMHGSLLAARERRTRLRRMMALEIEETPDFLRLYKLAGLNLITTYALVAIIGNIERFAHSKNLVSYLGLNPSVVESGNFEGGGALHGHGRGSLRALLIQASKRLLSTQNPLQKWGLSVALRRGMNKAARPFPTPTIPLRLLGRGRGPQADGGRLARAQRPLEQDPGGNAHAAHQARQAGHRPRPAGLEGARLREQAGLPGAEIRGAAHASLRMGEPRFPQTPSSRGNIWFHTPATPEEPTKEKTDDLTITY